MALQPTASGIVEYVADVVTAELQPLIDGAATALTDIDAAKVAAIGDVGVEGTVQVGLVITAGTTQIAAVTAAASAALAAVKQLVEITIQDDTALTTGAWYGEFFLPVATTFTSWKAWVFFGTGTADVRLLVDDVDVYGPRTVGTTTDTAAPSIAIAAGARVAFQIDNITGTPKGIAVQLLGLPT